MHAESSYAAAKRPCGLYQTRAVLKSAPDKIAVKPNQLVQMHNHGGVDRNEYFIIFPGENHYNRWSWSNRGVVVPTEYANTLRRLPPEGFYMTTQSLLLKSDHMLPARTLLQIGYNRSGTAVAFLFRFVDNSFVFATRGMSLTESQLQHLERAPFRVPLRQVTSKARQVEEVSDSPESSGGPEALH